MRRELTDFHLIEDAHLEIHKRLNNWARWCRPRFGTATHPMFRQYRAPVMWQEERGGGEPIDHLDAATIQKAVTKLPEPQMRAIGWYYVNPGHPARQARKQGVSLSGLAELVRVARCMLINRRA